MDAEQLFMLPARQQIAKLLPKKYGFNMMGFWDGDTLITDAEALQMALDHYAEQKMSEALALNDASEKILTRILQNQRDGKDLLDGVGGTIQLHRAALTVKRQFAKRGLG